MFLTWKDRSRSFTLGNDYGFKSHYSSVSVAHYATGIATDKRALIEAAVHGHSEIDLLACHPEFAMESLHCPGLELTFDAEKNVLFSDVASVIGVDANSYYRNRAKDMGECLYRCLPRRSFQG